MINTLLEKYRKVTRSYSGIPQVILGRGHLTNDSWGRPKTITDKSLFASKFTFNIIPEHWVLPADLNGTGTVEASNGALVLDSGTVADDYGKLYSRRHASYQANRGQLYSTALILPNPDAVGFTRRWGLYFTDYTTFQSGALFELVDGVLYGKTLTTHNGTIKEDSIVIDYSNFNLDGGALFDIQFQWRGVGDYFFYINQTLVGAIENLDIANPDNRLSIINPSLPARFECINTGGTGSTQIISGCVDITSEGGDFPFLSRQFIDSATSLAIPTAGVPSLIIYIPNDFKSQHNTRDSRILEALVGADSETILKVIITRDKTIFGQTISGDIDGETNFIWNNTLSTSVSGDSSIKYYKGANYIDLTDPTKYKAIAGGFIPKTGGSLPLNLERESSEVVLTHGDYLIVYLQAIQNASTGYATVTLGEEV